jgi:SAM-dependent methyltransferase
MSDHLPQRVRVERRPVDEVESRHANGPDWDRYADEYQATHGEFLGDVGFVWGPEGLTEEDAGILGPVAGRDVLEVGSGAGQCSRWVRAQGGRGIGLDLSHRQLQHSRRLDEETGVVVPSVLGTATALPFPDDSFDVVFSSFGALQFVADIELAVTEVARVLRQGGRFAFSITHPTRWSFPDDPGEGGLTATQSYWDRTPYVEVDDETGRVAYVEHHRTLGDWVRLLAGAGFVLTDLLEPEWPEGHERVWGGWSALRGRLTPGSAVFGARLDARLGR